ncbi:MAG: ATP-dependent DNA helicase RecG [Bacteroidales bacterium]|nr:ATP-dependent DNA helicase RecG [Bacteroidales bacterium]
MSALNSEIQYLSGVGPRRAALLKAELGVETFGDLLHIYPFRYIDRTSITPIRDVRSDLAYVQIQATVVSSTLLGPGGSNHMASGGPIELRAAKRLSVIVDDGTAQMEMVFFKGIKWNYERLKPGNAFLFFGKPSDFNGRLNMVHPEIDNPIIGGPDAKGTLTGVYPGTEKLKNAGITGKVMCKLQATALAACLPEVKETLPDYVLKENALVPLTYALRNIHFPTDSYALQKSVRRLKFEELFFLQLSLLKQKYIQSRGSVGLPIVKVGAAFNACFNALPYELTGAQKRVIREIHGDMKSGHQMNRLLQGDVGSGKTMVAVLSALLAVDNGYQACIMAPTEVLAQQHFVNISKYLAPTGVRCALLTGSSTQKERREIHAGLEDGSIGIIVGTHALIEDNVQFHALGLAIIDEQHRFGVDQRAKLWAKGPALAGVPSPTAPLSTPQANASSAPPIGDDGPLPLSRGWRRSCEGTPASSDRIPPHVLVMTATPIPRTLAMTLYGDLDVSVIDELPPGRKPVKTAMISDAKKPAVYKFMREQIAKGRQVFVVYPLIFESEKMDLNNLEMGYEEILKRFPDPDYKVAIVHGQQTSEVKNFNMAAFVAGRAQILVSTTVIEVGVDVPNASVMVIESAQRFGLSQLHQLRGRVGRGADESYCVLVHDFKTSAEAKKRLELMCATNDGFEIAEEDMKMRGPGDLEGTQQSGLPIKLSIASLAKDGLMLNEARAYADKVLSADPKLELPANKLLAEGLREGKYDIKDYSKIS